MEYIKKDFQGFIFPEGYVQCFQNKFIANAAMEKEIVRKKMGGDVVDADVRICTFVYEHVVATQKMLESVAMVSDSEAFKKRLDKLVLNRILNRFIICDDEKNRVFPEDALYIYSLDMGGKYLLEHFCKRNADMWNTGTPGLCVEKVGRHLVASDFHVQLMNSCPNKLKEFKCRSYRMGKDVANLSFEFRLEFVHKGEDIKRYFIGDVVREYDWEIDLRDRLEVINSICSTKVWQKYWPFADNPPVALFVVETEDRAIELTKILQMYKIPSYYVTTDARLMSGLNRPTGVWKKFDSDKMDVADVKTTMFMDVKN